MASEATAHAESAARLAAGLAADGDASRAVGILAGLSCEDLGAAAGELARMAVARDPEVFPRAGGDADPAPDWPAFWAEAATEARKADDTGWLPVPMTASRPGGVSESACLRVLLAAAAGTQEEAAP